MSTEPDRCPECDALKGHGVKCSRMTTEEKAAMAMQYYDSWMKTHDHYRELCKRLREQVTLWQGKHALLRHENNQLRRKLRPQNNEHNKRTSTGNKEG